MALVTKCIVNTCHRILVIHFIVGGTAVLVAKLGTRWSNSVYRGEWAYRTHSKAFKDKARLELYSKSLSFLIVLKSFICKVLKYKAGFMFKKIKIVCIATRTLVMNCYSRDLLVLS